MDETKIIKQLLDAYRYSEEQGEDAINFVIELLEDLVRHTEEEEPYATVPLEEMETAIQRLQLVRLDFIDL